MSTRTVVFKESPSGIPCAPNDPNPLAQLLLGRGHEHGEFELQILSLRKEYDRVGRLGS